jgi:hypothetical protein
MPFSTLGDPSLSKTPFNGTECATPEEISYFTQIVPELKNI